ncbi:MAG TPA: holin family protein [Orrella sp.]
MALPILIPAALTLIDKLFPDANSANDAKLKVLEMQQRGELAALEADIALASGQMETNKAEAQSGRLFISGWRPFIGWTCGAAFAFNFVGLPALVTISAMMGNPIELESLDMTEMMPVLLGMLGLGGFRTYEKINKANHRH